MSAKSTCAYPKKPKKSRNFNVYQHEFRLNEAH